MENINPFIHRFPCRLGDTIDGAKVAGIRYVMFMPADPGEQDRLFISEKEVLLEYSDSIKFISFAEAERLTKTQETAYADYEIKVDESKISTISRLAVQAYQQNNSERLKAFMLSLSILCPFLTKEQIVNEIARLAALEGPLPAIQSFTQETIPCRNMSFILPDGRHLLAIMDSDTAYPNISIAIQSKDGNTADKVCFVEYNSESDVEDKLCVGTYNSTDDDPQYYYPYSKPLSNETGLYPYLFKLNRCHHRTEETIGITVGVVFAADEIDAKEKAWNIGGSENSCKLNVWPIPAQGDKFTVYKGSF